MAETLTIAHLTDAHLPVHGGFAWRELIGKRGFSALNWARKRHRAHRREIAEAVAADIRAHAPDHVAMTGDAVNFGLAREFAAAADWLSGLGPAGEVSFVPGNHEAIMPGAEAERDAAYAPFITGDDGGAGYPWLRIRGPVALIGVSTSLATPPFRATGTLGAGQIAAMERLLAETAGLCRVVLIHHPPVGPVKRRKRLTDAAAFSAALGRAGAELVLHGHNHRAQLGWIDGAARIPVLGAPSASIGHGWKDHPAEWRLITVRRRTGGFAIDYVRRRIGVDLAPQDAGRFRLISPQPHGPRG